MDIPSSSMAARCNKSLRTSMLLVEWWSGLCCCCCFDDAVAVEDVDAVVAVGDAIISATDAVYRMLLSRDWIVEFWREIG